MMEMVIVQNVSKKFRIGFRNNGVLAKLISLVSGMESKKDFWVLRNMSFTAKSGEIIGVVGKNGSGKSTLLRVIAGILKTDKGVIKTNGRIISLINLNTGFQLRLSMRDNIYLCCSLFGLSRKEVKQKFNSIVSFAELKNYVDTKLYQFSSGMIERLAYSIAVNCNPEILLLDEAFTVGDEKFREKSAKKISSLAADGVCVLLVSHNLDLIKRHSNMVIWLDKGMIIKMGNTKDIIQEYSG